MSLASTSLHQLDIGRPTAAFAQNDEETEEKHRPGTRRKQGKKRTSCSSAEDDSVQTAKKRHIEKGTLHNTMARTVNDRRSVESGTGRLESAFSPRHGQRQPKKQQPKAPSNTTSFLMTDLEERQHEGEQLEMVGSRANCYSTLNSGQTEARSSSDQSIDNEEEQQDVDFEETFNAVNIERIEGLSREEISRELLNSEKDNRHLQQRVISLKESHEQLVLENMQLKAVLAENGIEVNTTTDDKK